MAKKKKVKCKRKTTKENSAKTFDNPIKKHIKQLNEMDNSLPTPGTSSEKYPEQKISLITQSRVTNAPIKEIAVEMLSNLQQKQILFNRNIRKERYNELQRLLMQSLLSSSPCSSVEKAKPAAMISAKRALIKTTSLASSLKTDSEKETGIDEKQLNLSGFNDAKSLLIQNDILLKLDENPQQKSASTGKSPESMDIVQNLDHSRGQHSALDSVNVPTPCENQPIDHAGDSAPLNTNKLKLMTCKKFFHCQQTEQNKHHVSSCIIVANEPLFRETCKSVPGFSGDCVDSVESTIKKKQIYQTQDSLDFLEYLDQSNTTDVSSSFWDSHNKFYTWNKTAFKDTSSDSENSPLWVPLSNLPPPPTKPCLDAIPSPPEKLYPRKLY
ncbi:unnamed protein product [Acanthosepion pharaonis]|uniref:Uncharacterized protein n=1 Tax=Acanthosepion pharaonis TaxID=158019 RepID=A0A812DU42_ACAPH|nr:unnamed protein product [Sepia pharaonis]